MNFVILLFNKFSSRQLKMPVKFNVHHIYKILENKENISAFICFQNEPFKNKFSQLRHQNIPSKFFSHLIALIYTCIHTLLVFVHE